MTHDVLKTLRLPHEILEEIEYVAKSEGEKFSETVRKLIAIGLNRKAAESQSKQAIQALRRPK